MSTALIIVIPIAIAGSLIAYAEISLWLWKRRRGRDFQSEIAEMKAKGDRMYAEIVKSIETINPPKP